MGTKDKEDRGRDTLSERRYISEGTEGGHDNSMIL